MTRIQFLSVAAVSGVLLAGAGSNHGVSAQAQVCSFRVLWAVPPPTITGTASITKRVDFIPQGTPCTGGRCSQRSECQWIAMFTGQLRPPSRSTGSPEERLR